MRQESDIAAVKEVQDAIVNPSDFGTEFVYPVLEQICGWSTQFISQQCQPLDQFAALQVSAAIRIYEFIEPLEGWNGTVGLAINSTSVSGIFTALC